MKSKIEAKRLKKVIEASMLLGCKTMIKPSIFTINKEGWQSCMMNTNALATDIILKGAKKNGFFIDYECDEETMIGFNDDFLEYFKPEFHFINQDDVTLSIKENKLLIESKAPSVYPELIDVDDKAKENVLKASRFMKIDDGLCFDVLLKIPIKKEGDKQTFKDLPDTAMLIKTDGLAFPHSSEYTIEFDGKLLWFKPKRTDSYKFPVTPEKIIGSAENSGSFDGDFIEGMLKHLNGTMLIAFDENIISMSVENKDHSISYALAGKDE